jgi:Zn-dependent protease with chaperone function
MDFFTHQDRAKARTGRLVLMYLLCVGCVVVVLAVAAMFVAQFVGPSVRQVGDGGGLRVERMPSTAFRPDVAAIASIGTLGVIGLGTLFKKASLGGDGGKVAEMLGGRLLHQPADNDERKLLNVVEEMSIASGVPMPRVYLMDNEQGINAFAAGMRPENAVIGVTRGCISQLSRDELQGVVAHEFSHILNGDMRLNLRLIAMAFGISVIGTIGYYILRVAPRNQSGYRHRSGDKDQGGGAIVVMMLAGVVMLVVGAVGAFFGQLLTAAVSRQREFLADASAVQFTRNPKGIAGALRKIGSFAEGAKVNHVHAGEVAHIFFAGAGLTRLLATHPPLAERIARIEGSTVVDMPGRGVPSSDVPGAVGFAPGQPSTIVEHVGTPEPTTIDIAHDRVGAITPQLRAAAADPYDARAVVIGLMLDGSPELADAQRRWLSEHTPDVFDSLRKIEPALRSLPLALRLPLVDLTIPSLQSYSPTQLDLFRQIVHGLADTDRRITPFEFAILKIIDHQIVAHHLPSPPPLFRSLSAVSHSVSVVLSVLSRASQNPQQAFDAAVGRLEFPLTPISGQSLTDLDQALTQLHAASRPVQRRVLDAAAHAVAFDGQIRLEELELLRALSASFDVPVPPLNRGVG